MRVTDKRTSLAQLWHQYWPFHYLPAFRGPDLFVVCPLCYHDRLLTDCVAVSGLLPALGQLYGPQQHPPNPPSYPPSASQLLLILHPSAHVTSSRKPAWFTSHNPQRAFSSHRHFLSPTGTTSASSETTDLQAVLILSLPAPSTKPGTHRHSWAAGQVGGGGQTP